MCQRRRSVTVGIKVSHCLTCFFCYCSQSSALCFSILLWPMLALCFIPSIPCYSNTTGATGPLLYDPLFTFFAGMPCQHAYHNNSVFFVSPKSRSFPIPPAVQTCLESFRVCVRIMLPFFLTSCERKKNNALQGMRMRTLSL